MSSRDTRSIEYGSLDTKDQLQIIWRNELGLIEGRNLTESGASRLLSQVWIEKEYDVKNPRYVIRGMSQIGSSGKVGEIGWGIPIEQSEADELFLLATGQKNQGEMITDYRKRVLDMSLAKVEKLILKRFEDPNGKQIKLVQAQEKTQGETKISIPDGWEARETANEIVRMLEIYRMREKWQLGEPSYDWFDTMGAIIADDKELVNWSNLVGLDFDPKGQVERLRDWVKSEGQDMSGVEDVQDWGEILSSRRQAQRDAIEEVFRLTFSKLKTRPSFEMDPEFIENRDKLIEIHNTEGFISTEDFSGFILNKVDLEIEHLSQAWETKSANYREEIGKLYLGYWAREVIRKQLLNRKLSPGKLWCDEKYFSLAKKLVFGYSGLPMNSVSMEMFDQILMYEDRYDAQNNVPIQSLEVNMATARRLFDEYILKRSSRQDKVYIGGEINKTLHKWLRELGVEDIVETQVNMITETLEIIGQKNQGNSYPDDWNDSLDTIQKQAIDDFAKRSRGEVSSVISSVVKESNFYGKLREADGLMKNRLEIWKSWQREVLTMLQRKAFLAQASLVHFENYVTQIKKSLNLKDPPKILWNDPEEIERFKWKRPDIYKRVEQLRILLTEVGWEIPDDLHELLKMTVDLAIKTDYFKINRDDSPMIMTADGLKWRGKME